MGWFSRNKPQQPKNKRPEVRMHSGSNIVSEELRRLMPYDAAGFYNQNQLFSAESKSIRHRCRKLSTTSDLAVKYVRMDVDNVVGEGITLKLPADVLNESALNEFTKSWNSFTKSKNFSLRDNMSFESFQRDVERFRAQDGESFVLIVDTKDVAGFRVDVIDAERVGAHLQPNGADVGPLIVENGVYLRQGIFFDTLNRVNAYRVSRDVRTPADTFDVPADHCLHLFERKYPDQIRGYSDLLPVIDSISQHEAYLNAELVAKKISAQAMGFITQNPQSAIGDNVYEEDDNDAVISETFEAGVFKQLPPGFDIKSFSGGTTPADLSSTSKEIVSSIARGLNVFYNSLAGDLSSINYSSARFGALTERMMWKGRQTQLIEIVLDPIFEKFVDNYAKRNNLSADVCEALKRDRVWITPKWQSVDPQKEAQYYETMIRNGLKTRHDVITETGGDAEYVMKQWLAEQEMFAAKPQAPVEPKVQEEAENTELTTEQNETEQQQVQSQDDE